VYSTCFFLITVFSRRSVQYSATMRRPSSYFQVSHQLFLTIFNGHQVVYTVFSVHFKLPT
jgi:hypothetical protein